MSLIPRVQPVGQPHIECDETSYTILSTGQRITTNQYGEPLNGDALPQALRFHGFPGVIIRTTGDQHRGMNINGGNTNQTQTVVWEDGPVHDVTIVGGEPSRRAKIGGVAVFDNAGDLRIQNITLTNRATTAAPFIVNVNGRVGTMRLYRINFMPQDPSAWNGKGMKWNIRGHGVARWDCRRLNFHKAVEHGAYIDNHQGDSYFVKCTGSDIGITLLQIVNRQESGPAAFGDLVIKNCVARNIHGLGGSDYSIVGNGEGTVWFIRNKSFGASSGSQGAFVHWTDHGHGAYLTPTGFSTSRLIIVDFDANHPNADRDHMLISGVQDVIIADWDIRGNKAAMHTNYNGGGGIDNGTFGLYTWLKYPPSRWPGWHAATKIKERGNVLSDNQIDDLEYIRGKGS